MTATRTPQIDWTRSKIRCTPFSLSSEKQQRKISSFENLITVAFTRQFFIEHAYFFVWKKSIFLHKTCNFVWMISAQPFCKRPFYPVDYTWFATFCLLSDENDHLKAENRGLKKDLLSAIETSADGSKVPLKGEFIILQDWYLHQCPGGKRDSSGDWN